MGFVGFREQNIKQAVERASVNVTNIADLHCLITPPSLRAWCPESASMTRILDRKLLAENIVVHWSDQQRI